MMCLRPFLDSNPNCFNNFCSFLLLQLAGSLRKRSSDLPSFRRHLCFALQDLHYSDFFRFTLVDAYLEEIVPRFLKYQSVQFEQRIVFGRNAC